MTLATHSLAAVEAKTLPVGLDALSAKLLPQQMLSSAVLNLKFSAREPILIEGHPAEHVYELVEGAVALSHVARDGRRHIVEILMAGDMFGIVEGDRYDFRAEALMGSTVRRYERRVADRDPDLRARIVAQLKRKVSALQQHSLRLSRNSATERIASFVVGLPLSEDARHSGGLVDERVMPMQTDIADYLGLTTETVCRFFSRLKQKKVVSMRGRTRLVILDKAALERLAA